MKKEGLFPQYYYKNGARGTGDAQKYGILKEEWLDWKETEQERFYELC